MCLFFSLESRHESYSWIRSGEGGSKDQILLKHGALTPEEITEMQLHCEIGRRIAQSVPELLRLRN